MAKPENIQNWHYTPISVSYIRIIELLPAQDPSDQLECRLIESSLKIAPEYNAVSYDWGDETNPSIIICQGAQPSVTSNLNIALRTFRHETQCITLWVDSICINQQDITELNNQVLMMGDIYHKVSHVYIWLGGEEEDDDPNTVMEYFKELIEKVYPRFNKLSEWKGTYTEVHEAYNLLKPASTFDELHQRKETHPQFLEEFNLLKPNSPQFIAFSNFFLKRPWFDSIWTFQESFLARIKTYFCGRLLYYNLIWS